MLNLHYYEAAAFEIVRVSYLLANRRFVVSEHGCDPEEEAPFSKGVVFTDYAGLVNACLTYLTLPAERRRIAIANHRLSPARLFELPGALLLPLPPNWPALAHVNTPDELQSATARKQDA